MLTENGSLQLQDFTDRNFQEAFTQVTEGVWYAVRETGYRKRKEILFSSGSTGESRPPCCRRAWGWAFF